jgi:membrane protease subunit HflK
MLRLRYLLLLALAAYLLTGVTTVSPEEHVVVRRFGKVVARPGPGLWIGLPWGMDRIERVPVRAALQLTVGYNSETWSDVPGTPQGQFLTGDQNLVNVQLVLDYSIGDGDADLDDYVNHRDRVEAVLGRLTEAAAAEWVAGRGVDQVLLTGNATLPAWVMGRVGERLPAHRLGVRLQRVSVGYLAPPEEVRAAFEAVTQAQANIGTKTLQAGQEAIQRQSLAEALSYKLAQEGRGYREAQLGNPQLGKPGQARSDAAAFLDELATYQALRETNPEILAFMWSKEMTATLTALKARGGKVKPLDQYFQNGELNVIEFFPLPKR